MEPTATDPPITAAVGTCAMPSFGGNSNGACCVVPFMYNNQPRYTCLYNPEQGYWCGTTNNFDNDRKWGSCGGQ